MLYKDDVVIGKSAELSKPVNNKSFKDTSVLYPYTEPAMVEDTVRARNQDDEEFCKVKVSSVRQLGIGDKFSSRHGQKGVTGMGYNQWDLLRTGNGITPGLTLNPHALPSRMTIGQLIEGVSGKVAAIQGAFSDATVFKKEDIEAIGDRLEELGYDRHGTEHCYDGRTGDPIDNDIFIAPTYYQRLQKFVVDEVYSISTGPTCIITRRNNGLSQLISNNRLVVITILTKVMIAKRPNCGNILKALNTVYIW